MKKTSIGKNKCAVAKKEMSQSSACCTMDGAATCELPCCEIRMEECKDGCKIYCTTEDEAACVMLQDLCSALEGGPCCIRCMCDGQMCCECRFDCCDCKCQTLMNGICIQCSTSDKTCVKMVQAMCACLCRCCENGCECVVCIDGTPVCNCNC